MKKKIGILAGGYSAEREVSLLSAKNILNAADTDKFDIITYEVPKNKDTEWIKKLLTDKPDLVLNLLHGGDGENGAVQGLLDCMGIKYYGSDVCASALCMSKNISKTIMRSYGIPTAEDIFIKKDIPPSTYIGRMNELGFPLIVKPDNGGSSIAISVADNANDAVAAAEGIQQSGDDVLIEKYIRGNEITCCVLKNSGKISVLPILDIQFDDKIFDYNEKYSRKNAKVVFSSLPEFMQMMITEVAKKAFDVLKCDDFATVDIIVKEEQLYVIEVNTIPGLTENSLLTNAVNASGTAFRKFINMIFEDRTSE